MKATVTDEGGCLLLSVALPNARLRLNRYDGDPYYAEAVEFDGGEIALDGGAHGGSPQLNELDVPDALVDALDAAVRERHA